MKNEPIVYRVSISRIAGEQASHFAENLRAFAKRHPGALVVDMSAVEFIDSEGLGALLEIARHQSADHRLILTNINPPILTLLRIARLHQVLDIVDTVEDALRQLE